MLSEFEEQELLYNSRRAALHSSHEPFFVGALIISSVYVNGNDPLLAFLWLGMSVVVYFRMRYFLKKINKARRLIK